MFKFRHFAFKDEETFKQLLTHAEDLIKQSSQTTTIVNTIAETEKDIKFYENNGYKKIGPIENYYRPNENCYLLTKSFT